MDKVTPIPKEEYAIGYSREKFQPLLDALDKGDFELAKALTPEGYRLCGYREYKETTEVSEYGKGWAGQYAIVNVPPGRYPVFAREFDYHMVERSHMNRLKNYPGLMTWVEGECVSSSDIYDKHPSPRVLVESPYCFAVAKDILSNESQIQLIPPFEARSVPFEYQGEQLVSYCIVDASLPELLKENPIRLRDGGTKKKASLDSMIEAASQKVTAPQQTAPTPDYIL